MKLVPRICIAVGYLLLSGVAVAQTNTNTVGACAPAEADAYLDAGNVRARILNNGGLFYRGEPHVYEVPRGSGIHSFFASALWIGGMVDGELRVDASRYGPWKFWPGPLDAAGNPPADCTPYDRIWEIRTSDVQQFIDTGMISDNLRSWPWHLGAPVVDGDGDPDNYNLDGGDLPQLYGDQRLWWIMNDRGNERQSFDTAPVGLEVHGSAHAFARPGFGGDATFYEFNVINKNEAPLEDAYFSIFADTDLGDWSDDVFGSDSLLHMGYTYNAKDFDGIILNNGSLTGYGSAAPALGITYLGTPLAPADGLDNDRDGEIDEPEGEMRGLTSVLGGVVEVHEYYLPEDIYELLKGLRPGRGPVYEGFNGTYDPGDSWPSNLPRSTTRFMFSGDPVTQGFWSELNFDGNGTSNGGYDRKFITTTGPFSMAPGDTARFRIGIVWARGQNYLDSVTLLKQHVRSMHSGPEAFYQSRSIQPTPLPPEPNHVLGFKQNYPNPFSQTTTLSYSLPKPMQVRLAVYDILGREVALLTDQPRDAGIYTVEFDAGTLPAGVYIAQLELDYLRFTKRMIIVD